MLTNAQIWEYIGYFGSVIVLLSFVMSSVVKLRIVNMIGSFIFAVYAIAIASYPTAVLNFCLVAVNIYHLFRMKKHDEIFSAHKIHLENEFLSSFIMFNGKDIQKYFDGYTLGSTDANTAMLVYCDMTVAGLLIGKDNGDGTMRIDLDYATPEFRDCRIGKYLYAKLGRLGFKELYEKTSNDYHISYIKKMGFTGEGMEYSLKLG